MRCFLLLLFSLTIFVTEAQIRKVTAESDLKNVMVFASGARLERTAVVALQPGRTEITFSGLSNQLEQQSVQLQAAADITLISVQATKDFMSVRKTEDQEKELVNKMVEMEHDISKDKNRIEVLKKEEDMLSRNASIGGQTGVKTAELKEALELHAQKLTEILQKKLDISNAIHSKEKALAALQLQIKEVSKKKDSSNMVVTAVVESRVTGSVNFRLLYNVKDAGWYPSYNVRVAEVSGPLDVLMNANVFQRSGETWKNVSLSLSTGSPNDNATPPQLLPWTLGFYDPSVVFRNQQTNGTITGRVTSETGEPVSYASITVKNTSFGTSTDGNGFFRLANAPGNVLVVSAVGYVSKEIRVTPGYYAITLAGSAQNLNEVVVTALGINGKVAGVEVNPNLRKSKKETIQTVDVSTEYQPTTTVYQIKDKYTIETDGKTTMIGIKQIDIPAMYEYYAVPKVDPAAYLTAKIVDWQDYDLQPGEASLFFEGAYLGKTYIDLNAATDTLSLSLGKDNGLKVTRRLVKEYTAKKFIGNNRTDTKTYEISVRNNKKTDVNIIVLDQFPVSTNKEISIDDTEAAEGAVDKETGIITWSFTLSAGQEKKLAKSYKIKYPKDKSVVLE